MPAVVVPFTSRRASAAGTSVARPTARHSLGVTAYYAGDPTVRWRTTNIGHALVQTGNDIHSGRSLFVTLLHCNGSTSEYSESATIAAAQGSEVLVLGVTQFAARIRERLAEPGSAPGLSLLPLPGPGTPLDQLIHPLSRATQALLERTGFSSAEELAAVSRSCWSRLHRFGPKRTEELAHVLRQQQQPRPHRGAAERRDLIIADLKPVDIDRHAPMIDQLAASDLPVATAAEVCRRLALEELPPLDPAVPALLDAAGADPALLTFYVRTHEEPAPRWPEA